jgi:Sec-independent protein translocase protein TatA
MRINELILENQQLDELSFAGVGKGIGQVASGVGQAVGGIKGAYQGAKQRYSQGKQQAQQGAYNAVTGGGQQQPAPAQNTQTAQPNSSSAAAATQPANPQDAGDSPEPAQGQQPAATTPPSGQATTPPAAGAPAGNTQTANTRARMGSPEGRKAIDQAVSTVKQVRSDRRAEVVNYGKQQFDALAGTSPTAESRVGYRSRFLDMDI